MTVTPVLWLNVAVNVPLQALSPDTSLSDGVDYVWRADGLSNSNILPSQGSIVVVHWAGRRCLGVVLSILPKPRYDPEKILLAQLLPNLGHKVLPNTVLKLAKFTSQYYHRTVGEVLLPTVSVALPVIKKALISDVLKSKVNTIDDNSSNLSTPSTSSTLLKPVLRHTLVIATPTAEQAVVLSHLTEDDFGVHLLYGITGSGKTEVYLSRAAQAIKQGKRVLILVPEIVLVPSMLARVKTALPNAKNAVLHSDISVAKRRTTWLDCLSNDIDILVGTRLAIFAPLSNIGLIVVDEEHDLSYKQQEGVRYCARNLAVVRGQLENCPVILGSATPSLETWFKACEGKYRLHRMLNRVKTSVLPRWIKVDLLKHPTKTGLSAPVLKALGDTLARNEQSLVFLNRRGFAPVLACTGCGWSSECINCSSYMALHRLKGKWQLVCHHCAAKMPPPKSCPKCGNVHLEPEGQGTQAIEDTLLNVMPLARIGRLDSDVSRKKGQSKHITQAMSHRELDVLVGTQMTAKGHDFPALSTVVIVGCDGMLASPDYRGVERLFALLTQVAGRAGRSEVPGTVWLQTRQAQHPVFLAVLQPSVDSFYNTLLYERRSAGLPPYSYQAVLRASHIHLEIALAWLNRAKALIDWVDNNAVRVFSPVPMLMPKVATQSRAQILFESNSRPELHRLLRDAIPVWIAYSKALRSGDSGYGVLWHLEVDPSEV
jgi:primosomal protein N' (replication factor Y) (superfamily II helicase)